MMNDKSVCSKCLVRSRHFLNIDFSYYRTFKYFNAILFMSEKTDDEVKMKTKMIIFKVARYIRCGNNETAYYETFITKKLLVAQQKYNEWKNDLETTRLAIWKTEHGQTEPVMMEKR